MFFPFPLLVLVSALATHVKGQETENLPEVEQLQIFLFDLKNEKSLKNVTTEASRLVAEMDVFNNYTHSYMAELSNQRDVNTSATADDLAKRMTNHLFILSVLTEKFKIPLNIEDNKLRTSTLQASHDTLLQFVTLSNVYLDKFDEGKNVTLKYSMGSEVVLRRTKRLIFLFFGR